MTFHDASEADSSITSEASPIAQYIARRIDELGCKQTDIARQCQFAKPNIITMLKQGKTKVPLERVGPLARALQVDPAFLFEMAMREYNPDTWDAIADVYGSPLVPTSRERQLIERLRLAGVTFDTTTPDEIDTLAGDVVTLATKNTLTMGQMP